MLQQKLSNPFSFKEPTDDYVRLSRLLLIILIATAVGTFLHSLILPFLTPNPTANLAGNIFFLSMQALAFVLMRRRYIRLASIVFVIAMWAYFTILIFLLGGSQSPGLVGYYLIVLIAGLLLGRSGVIASATLGIVAALILYFIEINNLLPESLILITPSYSWLPNIIGVGVAAVLLQLTTQSLANALDEARRNAAALAENNEQLAMVQVSLQEKVAELERAELALRQSQERLRLVVSSAPMVLWVADRDGVLKMLQGDMLREIGVDAERLIGDSVFVLSRGRVPQMQEKFQRALRGETFVAIEMLGDRTLEMHYSPLREEGDERITAVIGVAVDITEREQAEEALRQAQKLESLGVLAGGIAHDFNNLLVAMMAQNSVAMAKLDAEHTAYGNIEKAYRAAERAADLTRQMLAYAGRGKFDMGALQLNELVAENLSLLRVSIPKNVVLRSELADSLPLVQADAGQLQQVVMNLIINAADAIGDQAGEVFVKTGVWSVSAQPDIDYWRNVTPDLAAGDYVTIAVHDNGMGMAYETVSRIFDPFFSTKENGRGLGLAAVLGIVRSHGGDLWVHSEVGVGTVFLLLLPKLDDVARVEKRPLIAAMHKPIANGKPAMVLVIDDEEPVLEAVTDILGLEGISVITATGGKAGLALYQSHAQQIQLVLLDLSMPGMDGEETFHALRAFDPAVQVVLSSGYDEREAKGRFADKGLADFLQKPYDIDSLTSKVRQYL